MFGAGLMLAGSMTPQLAISEFDGDVVRINAWSLTEKVGRLSLQSATYACATVGRQANYTSTTKSEGSYIEHLFLCVPPGRPSIRSIEDPAVIYQDVSP